MTTMTEILNDLVDRVVMEDGEGAKALTAEEAEAIVTGINRVQVAVGGEIQARVESGEALWDGLEEKWKMANGRPAGEPLPRPHGGVRRRNRTAGRQEGGGDGMTARETLELIGRTGLLREGELAVRVEVKDAREVYGRTDLLVAPLAGHGTAWVQAERVTLDEEEA